MDLTPKEFTIAYHVFNFIHLNVEFVPFSPPFFSLYSLSYLFDPPHSHYPLLFIHSPTPLCPLILLRLHAFFSTCGPPKPEHEMIELIHHAIDSGITFLDTSDMYGPFLNEILLGKVSCLLLIYLSLHFTISLFWLFLKLSVCYCNRL